MSGGSGPVGSARSAHAPLRSMERPHETIHRAGSRRRDRKKRGRSSGSWSGILKPPSGGPFVGDSRRLFSLAGPLRCLTASPYTWRFSTWRHLFSLSAMTISYRRCPQPRDSRSTIQRAKRADHPPPSILRLPSSIFHPPSSILHPLPSILHPPASPTCCCPARRRRPARRLPRPARRGRDRSRCRRRGFGAGRESRCRARRTPP